MSAHDSIENLWDRATPVGPLLDAYRAEVLAEAVALILANPHPGSDPVAFYASLLQEHALSANTPTDPREQGADRTADSAILRAASDNSDDWSDETWAAWGRVVDRAHATRPKANPAAEVERWNATHPVGTPVVAYPGCRPEDDPKCKRLITHTRSKASVLGGHTAVVWVEGHSARISLTHVDPRTETGGAR